MCRVETPLDARGSSASRLLIPSAGGCRATTRRGSASSVIGLSQRQKSRGRKSAVKLANDLDYWGKARQSRAFQPHFHPSARGCYFTTPPPPSRQLLNDRLSNATAAGPLSVEPSKGQTLLFVLAAARRLVTMFELRSRGFRGPLLGQPFLRLDLRPAHPVVIPGARTPPAADASLCSADLVPFQCPRPSATPLS